MHLERRQALALAAGIALVAGTREDAFACARTPPPIFKPTKVEQKRMLAQLQLLRRYWNDGKPDQFIEQHCVERARLNYILDNKGGNWADAAAAIRVFHGRFPRIVSDFSNVMFDPLLPFLYAFAEFEKAPNTLSENEEIPLCVRPGMVPAFVVQMRFVETYYPNAGRLPPHEAIVAELSFREHGALANWFGKNA